MRKTGKGEKIAILALILLLIAGYFYILFQNTLINSLINNYPTGPTGPTFPTGWQVENESWCIYYGIIMLNDDVNNSYSGFTLTDYRKMNNINYFYLRGYIPDSKIFFGNTMYEIPYDINVPGYPVLPPFYPLGNITEIINIVNISLQNLITNCYYIPSMEIDEINFTVEECKGNRTNILSKQDTLASYGELIEGFYYYYYIKAVATANNENYTANIISKIEIERMTGIALISTISIHIPLYGNYTIQGQPCVWGDASNYDELPIGST